MTLPLPFTTALYTIVIRHRKKETERKKEQVFF